MSDPTTTPTPEDRRRSKDIRGIPLRVGELEWLVAPVGTSPVLDEIRDRVYDMRAVAQKVSSWNDLKVVAYFGIMTNYDVTPEECALLLYEVEPEELKEVVAEALFLEYQPRTYGTWIRSALIANKIRPEDVSPWDLAQVLEQLVSRGDAMRPQDFIASDKGMKDRKAILKAVGQAEE